MRKTPLYAMLSCSIWLLYDAALVICIAFGSSAVPTKGEMAKSISIDQLGVSLHCWLARKPSHVSRHRLHTVKSCKFLQGEHVHGPGYSNSLSSGVVSANPRR